ncbi:hypothetical protein ADUPG1_001228, partial [Aduncisulcus paluster]
MVQTRSQLKNANIDNNDEEFEIVGDLQTERHDSDASHGENAKESDEKEKSDLLSDDVISKEKDDSKAIISSKSDAERHVFTDKTPVQVRSEMKSSFLTSQVRHSDFTMPEPRFITVIDKSDDLKPANGVYVVKLKSADKDAALAFCNQLISIIETYPDIMIPPIANLMTTEVLTILNWRLEGPGFTVVDRASTSQDLIRSFIKKVRNASTDVFRVFVTFLSQAGAHECECSGEYVTSDQIARYAMKWIESQSSVLGQLSLMPEQEREAMDVFIRGLRPYEFQAKVRREVDACREAK